MKRCGFGDLYHPKDYFILIAVESDVKVSTTLEASVSQLLQVHGHIHVPAYFKKVLTDPNNL